MDFYCNTIVETKLLGSSTMGTHYSISTKEIFIGSVLLQAVFGE